ncbi:hypothetical protein V496_00131 [Pseudogymnoascus sp. VKM F-4515 (FW-2607)]|nr:hypothetical protein V496_00131 [Pseudogymnoascus sp. VKM F-4515 (FW-2607)]
MPLERLLLLGETLEEGPYSSYNCLKGRIDNLQTLLAREVELREEDKEIAREVLSYVPTIYELPIELFSRVHWQRYAL